MTESGGALFDRAFDEDATKVWCEVLKYQCALFSPGEIDVLKTMGLSETEGPLLDLGCGIGAYSMELKRRFPRQEIVGTDANDALLREFASDIKSAGIAGIRGIHWHAGKEPPPPAVATCGSALLSVVLQHVPDPRGSLSALRSSLPPKASVYIIEEDDGLVLSDPPCEAIRHVLDAWARCQNAHGGSRRLGRQIPTLARQAGLLVDDIRICAHSSIKLGLEPILRLFKLSLPLLVDGSPYGLKRAQAVEMAQALDRYVEANGGTGSVLFPKMIVRATVP